MTEEYKLTSLVNDDKTEIKYVYHLSDIHIRNIKRHEEYLEVFEKTYEKIKSESKGKEHESIIVLTGDIMHTKTELSPDANNIAYHFFKNLSDILPMILIAGNHDCIVSNQNRMDALTPTIDNGIGLEKVYYLKKTGFYQYHNIIFGLTDLFTEKPLSSENITSKMLKKVKQNNKYKIALYHGPIRESKTDLGFEIKSDRFRSKDFRGYDFGFFGDIHKFQYLNHKKTMAYAGSLIQQSFGESLNNHGILKWNLSTRISKLMEISNDYGYCSIHISNGKIIDTAIPKKPRINFILENTTQIQFQEIKEEIEKNYSVCEIIKENKMTAMGKSIIGKTDKILIGAEHDAFIKSYLEKKISHQANRDKVFKLHERIYNLITNNKDLDANVGGQYWKILELKYDNMFSYGKNNVVNFENYENNQIIGIVAPNHYGKSAILDIMLYCLFETCSRGKAVHILNKNEKKMKCSLLFSIGDNKYLIERTANRGINDARMAFDVNFMKIRKDGTKKNLNGVDKKQTNNNIIDMIGTYGDYLTSYICTQEQDKNGNFMNKTNQKKKEYLYEILKLNVFEECYNYAYGKAKKYNIIIKSLGKEIEKTPIGKIKSQIKTIRKELNGYKVEKNRLRCSLFLMNIWLERLKMPQLVKYNELADYNLETEKDIENTIDDIKSKIQNSNTKKLLQDITEYEKSIATLKKEKSEDTTKYTDRLQIFYDQLVNIPIDENEMSMETLLQNKKEHEEKINDIIETLTQLNKQVESINCPTNKKISQKKRDIMTEQLKMKEEFSEHVNETIKLLNKNKSVSKQILELQNNWLEEYNAWKIKTEVLLRNETFDLSDIKNKIESLTNKKEMLMEKFSTVNEKIDNIESYKKYISSNEKIKAKIEKTKKKIKIIEQSNIDNKNKRKELKELINKCKQEMENNNAYINHLQMLEEYRLSFMNYSFGKERHDKVVEQRNNLMTELNEIKHQINNNKIKLSYQLEMKKEYESKKTKLYSIQDKKDTYELYCQMFNTNGIPYEILKTILPYIEAGVNQTLHNMVGFDVEFVFYNEKETTRKTRVTKTMLNAIDINIHYQNQKSYSVQLASGFEKFIIGLAIRMVLCDISKSAKPNFFIIDEGWSCLDTENLSNIDNIMTYIKNQFEHVIIISHLEELKNQADYIINITKNDEYSCVNNTGKNSKKSNKMIEVK